MSGLGTSLYPMADSIGPPLSHRLDVGESETWAVDLAAVDAFIRATRETLGKTPPEPGPSKSLPDRVQAQKAAREEGIVGVVELAAGCPKRSRESIR